MGCEVTSKVTLHLLQENNLFQWKVTVIFVCVKKIVVCIIRKQHFVVVSAEHDLLK